MALARTPRSAWIEAGLRALSKGGPDGIRIEVLARTLGATKGSFYWHFTDRQALLEEILDWWERVSVDEVIEHVEREPREPKAKIVRLSEIAISGHAGGLGGNELVSIDLAVRDWARHDEAVALRLRRVDNRRMDYMRSLFGALGADEAEVEALCLIAYSLWIGNHFIAAEHPGRNRVEVIKLAVEQLLD